MKKLILSLITTAVSLQAHAASTEFIRIDKSGGTYQISNCQEDFVNQKISCKLNRTMSESSILEIERSIALRVRTETQETVAIVAGGTIVGIAVGAFGGSYIGASVVGPAVAESLGSGGIGGIANGVGYGAVGGIAVGGLTAGAGAYRGSRSLAQLIFRNHDASKILDLQFQELLKLGHPLIIRSSNQAAIGIYELSDLNPAFGATP